MLRELVDLASPLACVGCGAGGSLLCVECAMRLREVGAGPAVRVAPAPCPPQLPPVWALTAYAGVVQQAVVAHKDQECLALRPHLARLLRAVLAGAVEGDRALRAALAAGRLAVVPVPSSPRSVRARGRDPWREVVEHALGGEPVPVVTDALRVTRRVRDQAGLSTAERFANLDAALGVRRPERVRGRDCVVVDDVLTTGATVQAAAVALRRAGAASVRAAVIAATVRRAPTREHFMDGTVPVD